MSQHNEYAPGESGRVANHRALDGWSFRRQACQPSGLVPENNPGRNGFLKPASPISPIPHAARDSGMDP